MPSLRLAVISTSRSEFGQLAPIVRLAQGDARFEVRAAVCGMHLEAGSNPSAINTIIGATTVCERMQEVAQHGYATVPFSPRGRQTIHFLGIPCTTA
jgi:UDP-N-acetylglucosamine 2-epimerase